METLKEETEISLLNKDGDTTGENSNGSEGYKGLRRYEGDEGNEGLRRLNDNSLSYILYIYISFYIYIYI